jgi:NAD(P)-dependent dehydrogenase (short-subunit alcohol dehydrogenase family)
MRTVRRRKNLRCDAAIPTTAPTVVPRSVILQSSACAQQNRRCLGRKPALEPCSTLYETFGGYSTLNSPCEKEGRGVCKDMNNKVVLITGAKGGLGSFLTRRFLATGATVVGTSRSISQADSPEANFVALPVDFTNAGAVRAAVESIVSRFGRLDVLVHVMGGFAGGQTVAETDDATWERMRDLNLTSAFYALRAAIPHLRKSGKGRMIAIGSLAAVEPHAGLGAYVTFKAALTTLVRTVALENQDGGLTANVVLPGTMDTPANRKAMPRADFSKWVQPGDVADVVLWLADDRAAHITGAAIPVDSTS